jgi:hypothetical protein
MVDRYLVEVDGQERENEALRRLRETPFMLDELLASLGLPAGFYWTLFGVQHSDLVASRHGDVDLIAGRLAIPDQSALEKLRAKYAKDTDPRVPACQHPYFACLELAASGGLQWPPPLDYLGCDRGQMCLLRFPQEARDVAEVVGVKGSGHSNSDQRTYRGPSL